MQSIVYDLIWNTGEVGSSIFAVCSGTYMILSFILLLKTLFIKQETESSSQEKRK